MFSAIPKPYFCLLDTNSEGKWNQLCSWCRHTLKPPVLGCPLRPPAPPLHTTPNPHQFPTAALPGLSKATLVSGPPEWPGYWEVWRACRGGSQAARVMGILGELGQQPLLTCIEKFICLTTDMVTLMGANRYRPHLTMQPTLNNGTLLRSKFLMRPRKHLCPASLQRYYGSWSVMNTYCLTAEFRWLLLKLYLYIYQGHPNDLEQII